jgi:hypothetical protein
MSWLIDLVVVPLSYGFMQRGLVAAILVGIVCAVMGAFVVLRGLAFIGDAVSHAAFPGLVIAYILGIPLYIGGAIAAVGTALAIGVVARRGALRFDTAVGVLFAGMFAFGIVLFSTIQGYVTDLFGYLLGNVLGITTSDILQIAALGGIVLLVVALLRKELLYASFDPAGAARRRACRWRRSTTAPRADRRDDRRQHPGGRHHHGRRDAGHAGGHRPAHRRQVLGPRPHRHRRRDHRVGHGLYLRLLPERRVRGIDRAGRDAVLRPGAALLAEVGLVAPAPRGALQEPLRPDRASGRERPFQLVGRRHPSRAPARHR